MRSRWLGPLLPRCPRAPLAMPRVALLRLAAGLLGGLGASGVALGATPVGSEFQVNTYTTDSQYRPSVAADADGDFVVVWESEGSAGTDTSSRSIQGQRYDASGNAVGSEFQVNTYTTDSQYRPSVAVDADGDFVVVWESYGSAGSDSFWTSIQGQRYEASGTAVGTEFQVNTYTTSYSPPPRNSSVAAGGNGEFVVAWESYGSAGSDTSYWSIQGQRYVGYAPQVPSLGPPALIGLAALFFGIAAAGLRAEGRWGPLRERPGDAEGVSRRGTA